MARAEKTGTDEKVETNSLAVADLGGRGDRAGALITADETDVDLREYRLFASLDLERRGHILRADLDNALLSLGLRRDDFRLRETFARLDRYPADGCVSYDEFCIIIRPNILLVEQALQARW